MSLSKPLPLTSKSVIPESLRHIVSDIFIREHFPEKEKFLDDCDGKMAWTVRGFLPGLYGDRTQFRKFSAKDKNRLRTPHGFFALSDIITNGNLMSHIIERLSNAVDKYTLNIFALNEWRHTETYITVLGILFDTEEEMWKFLEIMLNKNSIQNMIKWMDLKSRVGNLADVPLTHMLLVQIFAESTFFLFPFSQILLFKHKGLVSTITVLNDAIIWDEDKHIVKNIELFKEEVEREGKTMSDYTELVNRIAKEAYILAVAYVKEVMVEDEEPGFSIAGNLEQLRYITNLRLSNIGFGPMFPGVGQSPFVWSSMTGLEGKTNFFERDVPEYAQNKTFTEDISVGRSELSSSSVIKQDPSSDRKPESSDDIKKLLVSVTGFNHESYLEMLSSYKS